MLQQEEGFLLAEGRQLDEAGQVFSEDSVSLGGAQHSSLYLVVEKERDVFLRGTFLPPLENLLSALARQMIAYVLSLIQIQKRSGHSILEDTLDSNPRKCLPILLVEVIPGVLVTHIIYMTAVDVEVVDG